MCCFVFLAVNHECFVEWDLVVPDGEPHPRTRWNDRNHVVRKMVRQPLGSITQWLCARWGSCCARKRSRSIRRRDPKLLHRRFDLLHVPCSAFVRGCPARGVLGGISRYTHEVVLLCQVAGYDPVIVESVGLGQNEVRVLACPHARQGGGSGRRRGLCSLSRASHTHRP